MGNHMKLWYVICNIKYSVGTLMWRRMDLQIGIFYEGRSWGKGPKAMKEHVDLHVDLLEHYLDRHITVKYKPWLIVWTRRIWFCNGFVSLQKYMQDPADMTPLATVPYQDVARLLFSRTFSLFLKHVICLYWFTLWDRFGTKAPLLLRLRHHSQCLKVSGCQDISSAATGRRSETDSDQVTWPRAVDFQSRKNIFHNDRGIVETLKTVCKRLCFAKRVQS